MNERYLAALHKVQTGIAYEMEKRPSVVAPKHLRVGLNSALVETAALGKLLLDKKLITHEEYEEAITVGMEEEAARMEKTIQELYGSDAIKLG